MTTLDNSFMSQHSMDWDLHMTFGGGDLLHEQHMPTSSSVVMDQSPVSSEASTGYLQDAVADWNDRCKRRRAAARPQDTPVAEDLEDLLRVFWDSNCCEDPLANLSVIVTDNTTTASESPLNSSMPFKGSETQLGEVAAPKQHGQLLSSRSNSQQDLITPKNLHGIKDESERGLQRKKKKAAGVVYPFAVVKPGGVDGDTTLSDINERLLMRPTRPVRHPVGKYACVPCVSANGPGLSGKAVVGFTRIQTRGRGTITIIRTRG